MLPVSIELNDEGGFFRLDTAPWNRCHLRRPKCEADGRAGDSCSVTDLPQAESHQISYFSGPSHSEPQPISAAVQLAEGPIDTSFLPLGSGQPEIRQTRDGTLVAEALERLRHDPSVSRGVLAQGLGVSPSKLGKAFRAQMGIAFVDYRNQLRLERFLRLVFPGGGNVSAAARSAGFGSYAQFHRVFRALVGKSPKEYLKQQTAHS
jgi:AraC-like DNA-binding protein